MRKVFTFFALLCTVCLNVQCQKAEVHMTDGSTVEIPTDEIDSITFSMTNPFNFETKTVKLNSVKHSLNHMMSVERYVPLSGTGLLQSTVLRDSAALLLVMTARTRL